MNDFLQRCFNEFLELKDNGNEVCGKTVMIKLHPVICTCDTPARAFVKCVKLYSGYYGCGKLNVLNLEDGEEKWHTRRLMPHLELMNHLLTLWMMDIKLEDPFLEIGAQMVSDFPIDYMHLVCLGVMKRMLLL